MLNIVKSYKIDKFITQNLICFGEFGLKYTTNYIEKTPTAMVFFEIPHLTNSLNKNSFPLLSGEVAVGFKAILYYSSITYIGGSITVNGIIEPIFVVHDNLNPATTNVFKGTI